MKAVSGRFSRNLFYLAAACACAGTAAATPAVPVISAGNASYNPATLTVTSTSAHTQISWPSFNVAAGEVLRFIQPNAQSVVLNQVFTSDLDSGAYTVIATGYPPQAATVTVSNSDTDDHDIELAHGGE